MTKEKTSKLKKLRKRFTNFYARQNIESELLSLLEIFLYNKATTCTYPCFHFVRMNCVTCNLMADFNKSGSKIEIISTLINSIVVIGQNEGS